MGNAQNPKIGILVVAYNAASTLASVLDRIPPDFRARITEVLVSDDHSQDATYLVGLGYKQMSDLPITIIRQPRNLGYGGNQKAGYAMAIEHGLDIIVMLHGDGQYAPECLPDVVEPLLRGEAEAVFGSRMLVEGGARRGGMPLYKYVGNKILTTIENRLLGMDLSEFHSGYRAYSVHALRRIPYEANSDGFNFDTQIIIQMHDAGMRIAEVPIPTFYGDEICYVNGMRYAKDVVTDVVAYRLHKAGLGDGSRIALHSDGTPYPAKEEGDTSHNRVVAMVSKMPPGRVLDLGCAAGYLAERLRRAGHYVVGVDAAEMDGVRERTDDFVKWDLEDGIPVEAGGNFDVVVAADVVEHVRDPGRLLEQIKSVVRPGGRVVLSVPNVSHWYPRVRIALGLFSYDQRGILDRTHLRFFTRRSITRLVADKGFSIRRTSAVGVPTGVLAGPSAKGVVQRVQRLLVAAWPTLFGYQFVLDLVAGSPGRPADMLAGSK